MCDATTASGSRSRSRTRAAAHLPNSGRLNELLVPGHQVWLRPADPASLQRRRTAYDLALVSYAGRLVSVDARLPGHLVAKALAGKRLPPFQQYPEVRREVTLGESRIDFLLPGTAEHPQCWIEVKSVTLVNQGTAQFPDAPTARGRRHVQELIAAAERGERAAVLFVAQREDAEQFSLHDAADPAFGQALREAAQCGVEIHSLRCRVTLQAVHLTGPIPVSL